MAILGELPLLKGDIKIAGKIGYASQISWIFSGTVKQNILFGQKLVESRYKRVIRACSLEKVRMSTILGEGGEGGRGVTVKQNILFGQKVAESKYKRVIRACSLEKVRISVIVLLYYDGLFMLGIESPNPIENSTKFAPRDHDPLR